MSVVVYHFTTMDHVWHRPAVELFPAQTATYGWLGVYLFFLISGFVICMSAWDRGVGSFLVSRAARLYPAYCRHTSSPASSHGRPNHAPAPAAKRA